MARVCLREKIKITVCNGVEVLDRLLFAASEASSRFCSYSRPLHISSGKLNKVDSFWNSNHVSCVGRKRYTNCSLVLQWFPSKTSCQSGSSWYIGINAPDASIRPKTVSKRRKKLHEAGMWISRWKCLKQVNKFVTVGWNCIVLLRSIVLG